MGRINSEKRTVELMINLYCRKKHGNRVLCDICSELRDYAFLRLSKCPYGDQKPACSDCQTHCYQKDMRSKIRETMRYSGPRMLIYYPHYFITHTFRSLFGSAKKIL
jgi:hypothetical protein